MQARVTAPHPEGVEVPGASDRVRAQNLPCYIKLLRRAHFCLLFQMIQDRYCVCFLSITCIETLLYIL